MKSRVGCLLLFADLIHSRTKQEICTSIYLNLIKEQEELESTNLYMSPFIKFFHRGANLPSSLSSLYRTFSSKVDASASFTKFKGFNQAILVSFQIDSRERRHEFENFISIFAKKCIVSERPHLQNLEVMRDVLDPSNINLMQVYISREGFENHRGSEHFIQFVENSGHLLADDVNMDEFKTIYPPQDHWLEKDVAETTCTIEVNMTVKEECLQEFVTITQLHCNSVADFMPVVAAEYGSDEDKSVNLSNDRESLRIYFIQNTRNPCVFKLFIRVSESKSEDILSLHKVSPSYINWSLNIESMLEFPRKSRRYKDLSFTIE